MAFGKWGSKEFNVDSNQLYTFFDFSTNYKLAANESNDDAGKPATNIKGTELRDMSFSLLLSESVGINTQQEIESWSEMLEKGDAYEFYLAGKPQGKYKWQLKQIDISEAVFDNKGIIRQCLMILAFKEYVAQAAKEKVKSKTKAKTKAKTSTKTTSKSSNSKSSTSNSSSSGYTGEIFLGKGKDFGESVKEKLEQKRR